MVQLLNDVIIKTLLSHSRGYQQHLNNVRVLVKRRQVLDRPEITHLLCQGSITVWLTSCFFLIGFSCFDWAAELVTCLVDYKQVKREVSCTAILPLAR